MYVCMHVLGMSLSIYPLLDNFDMRGSRGGLGSSRVRGVEGSRVVEGSRGRGSPGVERGFLVSKY